MPSISFDGQSLLLDGRRIWLVSGAIHYSRVPRDLWRSRIRAAKQAGLNCVETYVFWNLHESRPGVFDFSGEKDLRHFVELVGQEGLYCIVRPGPYVCAEWDFGGLPPWLHKIPGIALRQHNGPFLEACARYLSAVLEQVRDLQITENRSKPAPPGTLPNPIVMIQAENEWICHNDEQGDTYLREIVRYLRENGCTVPINMCNNLWQRVDGTIDTWNANQHLAADLRQLRVVQPAAPRFVTEFWPGWFDSWGRPHHRDFTAEWNLYRLGQILASGAQYNLYMFHGGTTPAFFGGRTIWPRDCFMTTSYDYDAPLREAGGRGRKYLAVKKISTFASHFGQLLAHLDPAAAHAAVAPHDDSHPLSVMHLGGSQGEVVFFLKSSQDRGEHANLLLADGQTLPVPLGQDRVAWVVLHAKLGGVAELNYTNLRPWAFIGKRMLVLFGPADAEGLLCVNDAPLTVRVPRDRNPVVQRHEQLTIVVLNPEQLDAAYPTADGLVIGAAGLDERDRPLPLEGWPQALVLDLDGKIARQPAPKTRRPTPPRLGEWTSLGVDALVDGSSDAFKPIPGPASLESLDCGYGYGWYRLTFKKAPPAARVLAPHSGDRLHVFADGKPAALLGLGPGADFDPAALKLAPVNVVLADNLGRFNFGWQVGCDAKGLLAHLHAVREIKLPKPALVPAQCPDPFKLTGFVLYHRRGDRSASDTYVWKIKVPGKRPLILDLADLPARALVQAGDSPLGLYDLGQTAHFGRFIIRPEEHFKGTTLELRLALFAKADPKLDPNRFITLYDSVAAPTEAAEWAFAPWTVPSADQFKQGRKPRAPGRPAWHRGAFRVGGVPQPLFLEIQGLSKGQLFLNGRNLGRYFVATPDGKAVPPQSRYYLPEPWLRPGAANEVLLFDEHGKTPGKCRLVYDPMGPYGE